MHRLSQCDFPELSPSSMTISKRIFGLAFVFFLLFFVPASLLLYFEPLNLGSIRTSLFHAEPPSYFPPLYIPLAEGPVLLVSAFFPLAKAKHTLDEYKQWLTLYLSRVTTDIYFFAPPEWAPVIREIRGDLPIVINTTFTTPFDIPCLRHRREAYNRMHALDRERSRHSPELYATWTAKTYFLREAVDNMLTHTQPLEHPGSMASKEYQFAFWSDAGAFRLPHFWADWPDIGRIGEIWLEGVIKTGTNPEDLIFFPIDNLPRRQVHDWDESMGPIDISFSEGSFFGGMPKAIRWWYNLYFSYHDYWLEKGLFVGKDQTVFNALFMLYPSRFFGVYLYDPLAPAAIALRSSPHGTSLLTPMGHCLNDWYYYIFFLGRQPERAKMADMWLGSQRQRTPCHLNRIVTLLELLKRSFGPAWSPPKGSLTINET